MAIIKCPECGHQVSNQAATCPSCGIQIAGKVMKCPECGEFVFTSQETCPNCHYPLHQADKPAIHTGEPAEIGAVSVVPNTASTSDSSQRQSPRKYVPYVIVFVVVLIAVFIFLYFSNKIEAQNETDAYRAAIESNEPTLLQQYLDMYPDAPAAHRDSVMTSLEMFRKADQEWANTVVNNSRTAFQEYIDTHPESVHIMEAKFKIDSIDWADATRQNDIEAIKTYIASHPDGEHIAEAQQMADDLEAVQVSPTEKQMVITLFTTFFNSVSSEDEDKLATTLAPVMKSFLHKENATKSDAVTYMRKLHSSKADINKATIRANNDWQINKVKTEGAVFEYNVNFSADQHIECTNPDNSSLTTLKVTATVSSDGFITDFNMKKVVE